MRPQAGPVVARRHHVERIEAKFSSVWSSRCSAVEDGAVIYHVDRAALFSIRLAQDQKRAPSLRRSSRVWSVRRRRLVTIADRGGPSRADVRA